MKLLVNKLETGYLLWSQVDYCSLSSLEPNKEKKIAKMITNYDNTIWQYNMIIQYDSD